MTKAEQQDAEATEFAMNLLMPESMVREHAKPPLTEQRIEQLADLFAVTPIVMTARLATLRLLAPLPKRATGGAGKKRLARKTTTSGGA